MTRAEDERAHKTTVRNRVVRGGLSASRRGPQNGRRRAASALHAFRADLSSPLYRNGLALIWGAGSASAFGFIFWVVAARQYTPDVVGTQAALIAALVLLAGVGELALNAALIRFLPVAGADSGLLIAGTYAVAGLTASVIAFAFASGTTIWAPALAFLAEDARWRIAFVVGTAAWCILGLQESALTGMRRAVWVPVQSTIVAVSKIVVLVTLAGSFERGGIFVSWILPASVAVPIGSALIFRRVVPTRGPATQEAEPVWRLPLRPIARYAGAHYVSSVLFLATVTLLPLVVINRAGAVENAYFTVPWAIATSLQLIVGSFGISLTVEGVFDRDQLRPYCRRAIGRSIGVLTPMVAVILVGAPTLLGLLGPDYAHEGSAVLRLLALSTIPNVVVALAISVARAEDRLAVVALIQGGVGAMTIGLAYALMPAVGITAVGLAAVTAQGGMAVALLLTFFRPLFSRQ